MTEQQRQAEKIREVAAAVGTRPEWLDALINFETGGTYDPLVKNPLSSARGLIQVIDATAQDVFGYQDSLALVSDYPDFYSQMDNVVFPYLQSRMNTHNAGRPLDTRQSLYMAVFYPAYMNEGTSKEFPEAVKRVNPGIERVQDYIDFVNARIRTASLRIPPTLPLIAILAAMGGVYWWIARQAPKRGGA